MVFSTVLQHCSSFQLRLRRRVFAARGSSASDTCDRVRVRRAGFQTGASRRSLKHAGAVTMLRTQNREGSHPTPAAAEVRASCMRVRRRVRRPSNRYSYMAETIPTEYFIQGVTKSGKTFRPSDWCERLCGVMSASVPGRRGRMPVCNIPCTCVRRCSATSRRVILDSRLRDIEPMAFDFVMNFAKDNDLLVTEACELPPHHGTQTSSISADESAVSDSSTDRRRKKARESGLFRATAAAETAKLAADANCRLHADSCRDDCRDDRKRPAEASRNYWAAGACRPLMAAARRLLWRAALFL